MKLYGTKHLLCVPSSAKLVKLDNNTHQSVGVTLQCHKINRLVWYTYALYLYGTDVVETVVLSILYFDHICAACCIGTLMYSVYSDPHLCVETSKVSKIVNHIIPRSIATLSILAD